MAQDVIKHIQALRKHPQLRNACAVVICESNMVGYAEDIKRYLARANFPNHCVMSETRKKNRNGGYGEVYAGSWTTSYFKEDMVRCFRDMLVRQTLKFWNKYVVALPEKQPMGDKMPREKLPYQLGCIARELHPATGKRGRHLDDSFVYKGLTADHKPAQTDYVMATGFILMNYEIFLTHPNYSSYR
jgi:hypothetical protein